MNSPPLCLCPNREEGFILILNKNDAYLSYCTKNSLPNCGKDAVSDSYVMIFYVERVSGEHLA